MNVCSVIKQSSTPINFNKNKKRRSKKDIYQGLTLPGLASAVTSVKIDIYFTMFNALQSCRNVSHLKITFANYYICDVLDRVYIHAEHMRKTLEGLLMHTSRSLHFLEVESTFRAHEIYTENRIRNHFQRYVNELFLIHSNIHKIIIREENDKKELFSRSCSKSCFH